MKVRIIICFVAGLLVLSCNIENKSKVFKPVSRNGNRTIVHEYVYISDSISITLLTTKRSKEGLKFELKVCNGDKLFDLKNHANLITLEDENGKPYIPEGSLILDSTTNEEYECDSTFSYYSEKLNVSFGVEKGGGKKLSLVIYNSQLKDVENIECTLHQVK